MFNSFPVGKGRPLGSFDTGWSPGLFMGQRSASTGRSRSRSKGKDCKHGDCVQHMARGSVVAAREHSWGTARLSLERMECSVSLFPRAHCSTSELVGTLAELTQDAPPGRGARDCSPPLGGLSALQKDNAAPFLSTHPGPSEVAKANPADLAKSRAVQQLRD